MFRLLWNTLYFLRKRFLSCPVCFCANYFCWLSRIFYLCCILTLSSFKPLALFSPRIHFINLYENSSDQKISPHVNNKYLWSSYFLNFYRVSFWLSLESTVISAMSVITASRKPRRLEKEPQFKATSVELPGAARSLWARGLAGARRTRRLIVDDLKSFCHLFCFCKFLWLNFY